MDVFKNVKDRNPNESYETTISEYESTIKTLREQSETLEGRDKEELSELIKQMEVLLDSVRRKKVSGVQREYIKRKKEFKVALCQFLQRLIVGSICVMVMYFLPGLILYFYY